MNTDTPAGIDVKVEYFALFRSCARKGEEGLRLLSPLPSDLYEELRVRYRFPLPKDRIHLVVNDEYSPWEKPLKQGDRVVFIPPVSGG
jgi:molybdopterin converting factor small subunit